MASPQLFGTDIGIEGLSKQYERILSTKQQAGYLKGRMSRRGARAYAEAREGRGADGVQMKSIASIRKGWKRIGGKKCRVKAM